MLAVGPDRPDGREQAGLNRPCAAQGIDDARLDRRLAPGRECRVVRRHRDRGEVLEHQHDLGVNLSPTVRSPCHSSGGPSVRRR